MKFIFFILLLLFLGACQNSKAGVSRDSLNAVQPQLTDTQAELTTCQQQLNLTSYALTKCGIDLDNATRVIENLSADKADSREKLINCQFALKRAENFINDKFGEAILAGTNASSFGRPVETTSH